MNRLKKLIVFINLIVGGNMNNSTQKTLEMTRLGLLVAMNAISAYLIIPLPFSLSPLALQTVVINLIAFLLKPKQAFITMFVYLLIGLIGIPVFTGGSSGPGKLFGPTDGYILGFLVAAVLIAWLKGHTYNFRRYALVSIGVGIPVIYLLGAIQLKLLTDMNWEAILLTGVVPFIPLDIVKCIVAAIIARPISRIFTNQI